MKRLSEAAGEEASRRFQALLRVVGVTDGRSAAPRVRDELVPVACTCDPPMKHGPHWVRREAVQKNGYLYGRARLDLALMKRLGLNL